MLDYLVTSESKKTLLNLLWKERRTATTSELARLSKLSYSTVHSELDNMEKAGLASSQLIGNARVYSANFQFPKRDLLMQLLNVERLSFSEDKAVSREDIILNMSRYGTPLGRGGVPSKRLSLEETIAEALRLSHGNPTVARSLPVLLFRRRGEIDFVRLRYFADRLKERQALGFFLEITSTLGSYKTFHKWAAELRDKRVTKIRDFFRSEQGHFAKMLAEKNTPSVAKKWNFRMNMEMDTFKSLFNKFFDVKS